MCCLLVLNSVTSTPQWIESVLVQQMESDGTHEDSSDSPLKGPFKQQTTWMLVLCQVSVPASVIAHVFGLSQHNVRRIEQGLSCKKIVSAIKSNLQSQLPLLQQTECQSRINHTVLEDLSRAQTTGDSIGHNSSN